MPKMSKTSCVFLKRKWKTSLSTILPFGVDFTQSSDRSAKPKLGYLARIAPEKGLYNLVAAFIELAKRPEYQGLILKLPVGWRASAGLFRKP